MCLPVGHHDPKRFVPIESKAFAWEPGVQFMLPQLNLARFWANIVVSLFNPLRKPHLFWL